MKIVCDNCSTKYSIADEKVRGKVFKIKCKKCSHIIVVKGDVAEAGGAPGPFDQKETKVFDYAGFDGKEAVPPNPPPGDAVWHLVIDREQVGPLTVDDVRQKWAAGEVDADTYAWREGFGDWLRIAAIDELAQAAPTSQHSATDDPHRDASGDETPPPEDAYQPPRHATGPTVRSDPADLFAAAAASAMDDESSGPELFAPRQSPAENDSGQVYASAPAREAPRASWGREPARASAAAAKHDPFEHADDEMPARSSRGGSSGGGGADADGDVDVRPMTGQRNENSVLFSLNNLASMASDSNGSARQTAPSSFPSTGGSEGSGLIDIRAMAAMTLGTKRNTEERPRQSQSSSDDLPVFSASSFSTSNAGVLLPSVGPPGTNKTVYVLIGFVGVLALAAIGLVLVIVLGKKEPAPTQLAVAGSHAGATSPAAGSDPGSPSNPPPSSNNPGANAAGTNAVVPATGPSGASGSSGPSGTTGAVGTAPGAPSSPPAAATPPTAADNAPAAPQPNPGRPGHPAPPTPKHPDKHVAASAHQHDDAPPPPPPPPPVTERVKPSPPPGEIPKPTGAQKCDEIACMVTPDLPCCPKNKGGSVAAKPSAPAPAAPPSPYGGGGSDSSLPDKLDQPAIITGMQSVTGKVMACNDRFHIAGAFKIAITVSADGNVTAASATPPIGGTPAGTCAEGAVHGAHFKKTKNPITFKYPFTFH